MAAPSSSSKKMKFNCGYGGKFMVCGNGAKLRYVGGTNKIITVDRSISYNELIVKMWDMCGLPSMSLRCKLPKDDLDLLVLVRSDEDLDYVMQQYDCTGNKDLKIRAILDPNPPLIAEVIEDYWRHNKVSSVQSGYHANQAMAGGVNGFLEWKKKECSFY